MKLSTLFINKTPLYLAVENRNAEAVKFLLTIPDVNINEKSILN